MVLFGLTVIVVDSTGSKTAVSLLILSFLVPAVLFSAVAGVYVDRIDRRLILIATNVLRGLAFVALYLAGTNLALILLLNIFDLDRSPCSSRRPRLAMIPVLVPRSQLLAANGIFTLTLNAAFALGLRPARAAGGQRRRAARRSSSSSPGCTSSPRSSASRSRRRPRRHRPRTPHAGLGVGEASGAMGSTLGQLREGFTFIRGHRAITWSLIYLAHHGLARRRARRPRARPSRRRRSGSRRRTSRSSSCRSGSGS